MGGRRNLISEVNRFRCPVYNITIYGSGNTAHQRKTTDTVPEKDLIDLTKVLKRPS